MSDDTCIHCGGELPPLNGSEENDFCFICEYCRDRIQEEYDNSAKGDK